MTAVVVALDGLAVQWLPALAELSPALFELIGKKQMTKLDCSGLREPVAIWHEIVSETSWKQSGVYGFATPRTSLNDLQVVRNKASRKTINLPNAETGETFSPFATWVTASASVGEAVQAIRQATRKVKNELFSILQTADREIVFARFDFIDHLSHLLGPDFILAKRSPHRAHIENVIKDIDSVFEELKRTNTSFQVISSYGMQPCNAMINLNRILEAGGFCKELEPASEPSVNRRLQSLQLMHGTDFDLTRPDALMHVFELEKTRAASPVARAIYINDEKRFERATVNEENKFQIQEHIVSFLKQRFQDLGASVELHPLNFRDGNERRPDIICEGDGVSFDLYGREEIDELHKPRAIHTSEGFWLTTDVESSVRLYELVSRLQMKEL